MKTQICKRCGGSFVKDGRSSEVYCSDCFEFEMRKKIDAMSFDVSNSEQLKPKNLRILKNLKVKRK